LLQWCQGRWRHERMPGNKFASFLCATTQIVKVSISFIVTLYIYIIHIKDEGLWIYERMFVFTGCFVQRITSVIILTIYNSLGRVFRKARDSWSSTHYKSNFYKWIGFYSRLFKNYVRFYSLRPHRIDWCKLLRASLRSFRVKKCRLYF
jgi:hypothetical protein